MRLSALVATALGAATLVHAAGCAGSDDPVPPAPAAAEATPASAAGREPGDPAWPGPPAGRRCPDLLADDRVATFAVDIDPAEWAALLEEYRTWREREAAGLPRTPYHPLLAFRHDDELVRGAMIRLRGHHSWDENSKPQFAISFNELDPAGRFHGLRQILLDAPVSDPSFLRQRVAAAYLADLGVPAACAASARLVVNGAYFGLYTHLERIDRSFLARAFGDDGGWLYKYGKELRTHEAEGDGGRLDAFEDAYGDLAALAALADLDAALLAWAAEAVIPQADGYWAGRSNFYLYDHPALGFFWIPFDLDNSFDFAPVDANPDLYLAHGEVKHPAFATILADPAGRARWQGALERALAAYDPGRFEARVDAWAAQIADAVAEDPSKPFSTEWHRRKVEVLRAYLAGRADFVRAWLACARAGEAWCASCEATSCARP
jgi:hypothetical protein